MNMHSHSLACLGALIIVCPCLPDFLQELSMHFLFTYSLAVLTIAFFFICCHDSGDVRCRINALPVEIAPLTQ